jgi:hypothetical protein
MISDISEDCGAFICKYQTVPVESPSQRHRVISHKTQILSNTAVRTSDLDYATVGSTDESVNTSNDVIRTFYLIMTKYSK